MRNYSQVCEWRTGVITTLVNESRLFGYIHSAQSGSASGITIPGSVHSGGSIPELGNFTTTLLLNTVTVES